MTKSLDDVVDFEANIPKNINLVLSVYRLKEIMISFPDIFLDGSASRIMYEIKSFQDTLLCKITKLKDDYQKFLWLLETERKFRSNHLMSFASLRSSNSKLILAFYDLTNSLLDLYPVLGPTEFLIKKTSFQAKVEDIDSEAEAIYVAPIKGLTRRIFENIVRYNRNYEGLTSLSYVFKFRYDKLTKEGVANLRKDILKSEKKLFFNPNFSDVDYSSFELLINTIKGGFKGHLNKIGCLLGSQELKDYLESLLEKIQNEFLPPIIVPARSGLLNLTESSLSDNTQMSLPVLTMSACSQNGVMKKYNNLIDSMVSSVPACYLIEEDATHLNRVTHVSEIIIEALDYSYNFFSLLDDLPIRVLERQAAIIDCFFRYFSNLASEITKYEDIMNSAKTRLRPIFGLVSFSADGCSDFYADRFPYLSQLRLFRELKCQITSRSIELIILNKDCALTPSEDITLYLEKLLQDECVRVVRNTSTRYNDLTAEEIINYIGIYYSFIAFVNSLPKQVPGLREDLYREVSEKIACCDNLLSKNVVVNKL